MLDMDNAKYNMTLSLAVAYNGKPFSGFARQPGQLTVQGELEHALELLFRREVETTCAGRTDAGVHARAQVVSFDISPDELRDRTLESLARSMNALTHEAIVVRSVEAARCRGDARGVPRAHRRARFQEFLHGGKRGGEADVSQCA